MNKRSKSKPASATQRRKTVTPDTAETWVARAEPTTPDSQPQAGQSGQSAQADPANPAAPSQASQAVGNATVMRQAAADVQHGLVDTGRDNEIEPLKRKHYPTIDSKSSQPTANRPSPRTRSKPAVTKRAARHSTPR